MAVHDGHIRQRLIGLVDRAMRCYENQRLIDVACAVPVSDDGVLFMRLTVERVAVADLSDQS